MLTPVIVDAILSPMGALNAIRADDGDCQGAAGVREEGKYV